MAVRAILHEREELLRKRSRPVEKFDDRLFTLIDDMAETMHKANGVGLAAPQVGILRRAVVIDIGEGLVELINPEFIEVSGSQTDYEGCLSIPGHSAPVERPNYAKVRAFDREGREIIVEGKELMARALCHEIDHLDGILYIDKAMEEGE